MENYIVYYQDKDCSYINIFRCQADNKTHAKEQAANVYPEARIIVAAQYHKKITERKSKWKYFTDGIKRRSLWLLKRIMKIYLAATAPGNEQQRERNFRNSKTVA